MLKKKLFKKKENTNKTTNRKSCDFGLTFIVVLLVIFGVIMVFSSSYYNALESKGDAYFFLKRDAIWALLGFFAMMATSIFNYRAYSYIAPYLLAFGFILLGLLFTPLGLTLNYATRWLSVWKITVMPGEVMKLCLIIFLAWYFDRYPDRIKSFFKGVMPVLVIVGAIFALIIKQPNLSTAITITLLALVMMLIAGMKWTHFIGVLFTGIAGVAGLIIFEPYRMKRFTTFIDPFADPMGDGYQVVQSLLALGSGRVFGLGIGKSIQKTLYLPEPQNDFIFAIIGEELGFIGGVAVVIAFMFLIWRGFKIALNAKDRFGTYLASGIVSLVGIQVFINIAVATSSMPATGIALPFISWGGNTLLIFMASMGIVLNISKTCEGL